MKRLTALSLAVTWMFVMAAPPVATATEVSLPPTAEECVASDGAAAMAVLGCDPSTTGTATVIFPNGTVVEVPIECDLEGVNVTFRPDGGADVECDYGLCGTEPL